MFSFNTRAMQRQLNDRKRLAIIGGLLLMLFGVAMYFFIFLLTELNARMNFSGKELLGLEYIRPLFMLKHDILEYRHLINAEKDDPIETKINSLQRQIDHDIQVVDKVDHDLESPFSNKTLWEEIKEDWQILRIMPPNERSLHAIDSPSAIIADLNTLIAEIGDRSNLILDANLDGYYLKETIVNRLPTMIEQLELARSGAPGFTEPPKPLSQTQLPLANRVKLIKLTRKAIAHNLNIFFSNTSNKSLRPPLEAKMKNTEEALDRLQAILSSETGGMVPTERWKTIAKDATEAIGATVQLFDAVVAALDETVRARIAITHRQMLSVEVISGGVIFCVVILLVAFLRIDRRRKQAELEITAQENRLQAIIDGALDAVVTMDHRSLVVEWNPQADTIFGFSRMEAVGKPLTELIIPERYREAHAKGLQRFLSTGQAKILRQRIEITALRKNGEEFPVELTVIPVQLGGQTFFSSFIRDITEQKQAKNKLQESTSFIESVLEHLPDMVFVKDAKDLRFVRFNKAGEELLGYSRSELLGKNDYDFFPQEEADFFIAKDRETLSGGSLVDIPEEPLQTKSKGIRILHTKKIPICGSDGTPQYLLGISEDITEHKQAIKALKTSDERFQLAVRGSTDGIWDWNMTANESYFSPRYKELLGYSEDEFPNTISTFWSHLHPEDRPWATTALTAHFERRYPYDIEYRMRTKSGEYRWFRARGQAMWNEMGEPVRMAGSITDITKNKEAETALIRNQLEVRKASQAKSDFLANMSHEMRTPLNAVVGITDYLAQTPLSTEQLSLVARCAKAADGLLRMIEDLLLAAKTESGTLELVEEPFALSEIVTECTELLGNDVQRKGLSLTLHMDHDLPAQVVGDGYRLQQVLLNLIRNAVKFTPSGSISIHVAPVSLQQGQAEILVRVVDTGVGIPPGQREEIFERFSQADQRVARQFGGVGLGLSICKQLVEQMGGRIWADNNQGGGSTFSFTILLKTGQSAAPHVKRTQSNIGLKRPVKARSRNNPAQALSILLAEDFIEFQDIMRLYLRGTPHHLDCAATGNDAVALFKTKAYDLVFMDLQMPEMDGYHATRLIREWEAGQNRPPTPIIALTANALSEARHESLAAGCSDFLTKPIKRDAVLQTIQRYASGGADAATGLPSTVSATEDQSATDELQQLKSKFLRNRQRDVTALQAAIDEKDIDRIRTIGHRIKGLAGSYELHDIGAIGSHIEQAALNKDIQQVTVEVSRLLEAVREANEASPNDPGHDSHAA
jgi:PAS domain S-box-containing protein